MARIKKLAALLLVLLMTINVCPGISFAAEGHECTAHGTDEPWIEIDESITKLEADKYYYLSKDTTLTHNLTADENAVVYLCMNGYKLNFENGAYINVPDSVTLDIRDCGDMYAPITADLEFSLKITDRIHGLSIADYGKLKSADFVLYAYSMEAHEIVDFLSIEASSVDKSDNSEWKVKFNDVPISYYDSWCNGYAMHSLELGFKNWDTTQDVTYLADTTAGVMLEGLLDDEGNWVENAPLKKQLSSVYGYKNIVLGVTVEGYEDLTDTEFTAYLLRNGEKIREFTFDVKKDQNISFTYLDGEFIRDSEGFLQDDGSIDIPVTWDGEKAGYTVEIVSDRYSLKLTSSQEVENDEDSWPSFDYTYYYAIEQGTKVDDIALNIAEPQNGRTFPTTATTTTTGISVEKVEWKNTDGDTLDSSATAVENTEYYAVITVGANEGYYIPYDANATVNGYNAISTLKNVDGTFTVQYLITATEAPAVDLALIKTLNNVTLEHDADTLNNIKDNLPATVEITTTAGTDTANVTWGDVEYDATDLEEQPVIVKGTVTLPNGVANSNNVPLEISRTFIINAAPRTDTPVITVDDTTTYGKATITITAADGAKIYYTTEGSDPIVGSENCIEYTAPITIDGKEGEGVVYNITAIAVKDGERNSLAAFKTGTLNTADQSPEVKITVAGGEWNAYTSVSFGIFKKAAQTVTVTAEDFSGIKEIKYLVTDTIYGSEDAVETAVASEGKAYNGSFTIEPNGKNIIYVVAEDNAGNIKVANSGGIILYTDSESQTTEVEYTKVVGEAPTVIVELNDNTVKEVKVGSATLIKDTDYAVNDNKITLKKEYLETLAANDYTCTISYNPMGEAYVEAAGNDVPVETTFTLKVVAPTVNPDGSITDKEGNTYIPVDPDGDGVVEYIPVTPNGDGSYTDGSGNTYIPTDDGFKEITDNGDGTYKDGDGNTYIPVDKDGDGNTDEYVPVTPNGDGTYKDDEGNTYIPVDKDGDGIPDVYIPADKNNDGTYTDGNGNTYVPVDKDGDGTPDEYVPADKNNDGTYTDGNGNTYVPVDKDDDGTPDVYVPVDKNDDGSYTDNNGTPNDKSDDTTYIPTDDGLKEVTPNENGTYTDEDDNTYIPTDDGFKEITDNGDGTYKDNEGNTYIPTDDGIKEVTPNEDGSYTDENGKTYIPVDNDGDGTPDEYIPADKNNDGTYKDADGDHYLPVDTNGDGKTDEYIPVDKQPDGSYKDSEGNIYIPVDKDGDGATDELVVVKPNADGTYGDDADGDDAYGTTEDNHYDDADGDGIYTEVTDRVYEVEDGDLVYYKNTKKDLTFTIYGPYDKFEGLAIDGEALETENYTTKEGSTIITLKSEYLESLDVDKYELTAAYENGTAETTLTVKAAAPKTSDNSNVMLYAMMLVISTAAVSVLFRLKKRTNK